MEVPAFLSERQSIRMGHLRIGKCGGQQLSRVKQVPPGLNKDPDRLGLLSLFSKLSTLAENHDAQPGESPEAAFYRRLFKMLGKVGYVHLISRFSERFLEDGGWRIR